MKDLIVDVTKGMFGWLSLIVIAISAALVGNIIKGASVVEAIEALRRLL